MRLDKLTTKFQQALADAQSLAVHNDQQMIEPSHLLLALLQQDDGSSSALLAQSGVNVQALKAALDQAVDRLPRVEGHGGEVQVIGRDVLVENGHMTFSPVNKRWMLSDTYPDDRTHERFLFLFDMQTGERRNLGSFYATPDLSKENRCDLHPRWSRDGRQVCIDSVHEHQRQMYVLDVSAIVG